MPRGPEEWVERLLRALPREEPPEIALSELLDRLQAGRRRGVVLGGLALAATVLAVVLLSGRTAEPPVHLPLRVVDYRNGESVDEGEAATLVEGPLEVRQP